MMATKAVEAIDVGDHVHHAGEVIEVRRSVEKVMLIFRSTSAAVFARGETLLVQNSPSPKNLAASSALEEAVLLDLDAVYGLCRCQSYTGEKHDVVPPCDRRRLARTIISTVEKG